MISINSNELLINSFILTYLSELKGVLIKKRIKWQILHIQAL